MPCAQVVAVVTAGCNRRSEIGEKGRATIGEIIVIAHRGPGAGFMASPGGIVAVRVLRRSARLVGVITQGENTADVSHQHIGGDERPISWCRSAASTLGNVTRRQDHGIRLRGA